jgi:hypothetical protein
MGVKIHNFVNLNSKKFSVKFFNQRLPFIYILFNFFYRTFIVNLKSKDPEILDFHKLGFTKINISLKDEISEFKDKFFIKNKEKKNKKKIFFDLDGYDKKKFLSKIKKKLSPFLNKLENYYGCDCKILDVVMWRNNNFQNQNNLTEEHFAEHFHQDSYLMTYSKIHINLMDVNEDDGPLEIVPIENRSAFIKSFNYKDRYNYNFFGDKKLIKKNIGKIGDCIAWSSPQVYHRAGIPRNYRDMCQIILISLPKKYSEELDKINHEKLFDNNQENFQKFTKPYSIIKVVRLFFIYLKYKLIR